MSRFDDWMWHATDFLLWRYVRFAMIGISLIVGVWSILQGFRAVLNDNTLAWVVDTVFAFANGFLVGYNFKRYKRDFWA
jgi:hypothetical protein